MRLPQHSGRTSDRSACQAEQLQHYQRIPCHYCHIESQRSTCAQYTASYGTSSALGLVRVLPQQAF